MKTVLITGASGFIGRNLCVALRRRADVRPVAVDVDTPAETLAEGLASATIVLHLAGVNRPQRVEEFVTGNADFTSSLCEKLGALGRRTTMIFSSSVQAELDNPYGASKRAAEQALKAYAEATGSECVSYRLTNVFGKWCRPNYNSVTATFCHNIAHDLPIEISDPTKVVELTYIDDVVASFLERLDAAPRPGFRFADPLPSHPVSLGELAALVRAFRDQRTTLVLPDFCDPFVRALYATYLSYLEPDDLAYDLKARSDERGSLAEFIKAPSFGQIFLSRTKPGITRGNHYHHTKVEKFLVLAGEASIRLRPIEGGSAVESRVRGDDFRVVDIPPGYAHSITNIGSGELVTLFWASEVFDPSRPDTIAEEVNGE